MRREAPALAGMLAGLLVAVGMAALPHEVQAQAPSGAESGQPLRDPTEPPGVPGIVRLPTPGAPGAPGRVQGGEEVAPFFIMSVGGRLYVIKRSRRLGVGDMLDSGRIVRIEDGAVWVRESDRIQQLPVYKGVTKRPVGRPVSREVAKTAPRASGATAPMRPGHRHSRPTESDAP